MLHETSATADQQRRLALHTPGVFDTQPEERFDRITRTARRLFDVPVALIAFVDGQRHWFKSCQGIAMTEVPSEISLCDYTLRAGREFIVADTHAHPDLVSHPFVSGTPYVRFYAGKVLRDRRGEAVGTLCVMGSHPRPFSEKDLHALNDLAGWAEEEINSVRLSDALLGTGASSTVQELAPLTPTRVREEGESRGRVQTLQAEHRESRIVQAALRQVNQFLHTVLDALTTHIAIVDQTGTIIAVNTAWRRFTTEHHGTHEASEMGVNYLTVCDTVVGEGAENARMIAVGIRRTLQQQDSFTWTYACQSPTAERWFTVQVTRFIDREHVYAVVAYEEVTALKQAEQRRVAAEHLQTEILNSVSTAIGLSSPQGIVFQMNDAALKTLHLSRDEIEGHSFLESSWMHHDEAARAHVRSMIEAVVRGETVRDDLHIRDHSGRDVVVDTTFKPLYDTNGRLQYILGEGLNITDRKHDEERLRRSEQYFHHLADTVPVAIWMTDTSGECEFVNQQWLTFCGHTVAQELGKGWQSSLHPEDVQRCREGLQRVFLARQPFEQEYRMRRADGEYRWMLDRGAPRFLPDGSFAGYVGSVLDITERKQAEAQLTASLQEKEVLLKEIHHRVKNNLQVVSSLLSLQAGRIGEPDIQAMFHESQTRVQSMAFIHEHLYQSTSLAKVDFAAYVHRLTSHLLNLYRVQTRGVRLTIEVPKVSLGINAAVPCGLIINELVSNALKYAFLGDHRGEISVSLSTLPQGQWQLIVRDTGVGLPPGFDFRQATSLGLQLVTALTEQVDGTLTVESGQGTAFILTFAAPPEEPWEI